MAIKTGSSHALATLLLTLVSALLIYFLKDVGAFETIFDYMLEQSYRFSAWLENNFNVQIHHEIFPIALVAALLAFLWGFFFHITRK
jgi:hypothetical protein